MSRAREIAMQLARGVTMEIVILEVRHSTADLHSLHDHVRADNYSWLGLYASTVAGTEEDPGSTSSTWNTRYRNE